MKEVRTKADKILLNGLGEEEVHIGVVGERNAEIINVHEFGFEEKNIPARMPFRTGFDQDEIAKKLDAELQGVEITERVVEKIGQAIGLLGTNAVKQAITDGLPPPVSEKTLEKRKQNKESSLTLYDTGNLLNSINYDVI